MALQSDVLRPLRRVLPAGAVALLIAIAAPPARAQSGELIPSIGVSKAVHAGEGNAQVFGGLAVRAKILPMIKGEVRGAYREERISGGDLRVRQWPVTASLWLSPISMVYAGGGVGWYHTTFHYADRLGLDDRTTQRFGAHLGGGLELPLVPHLAVDLNGRYVFLKKENEPLFEDRTNPDFWNLTAGLAIKL